MPWLQSVYERFESSDLEIVGLTTVNRTATDQSVREFLDEHDITFPVLKENGVAREYFEMQGTPFTVIVQDGLLTWEDQLPNELFPEAIITSLLSQVQR